MATIFAIVGDFAAHNPDAAIRYGGAAPAVAAKLIATRHGPIDDELTAGRYFLW